MPRAVVVLTGSELVRGDKADANGAFLARELTRVGLAPARMLVVGDDPGELEEAVAEAMRADVAVFSGGLGPTHDDRTVETIARVAGRELIVDEELAREIEAVARGVAERIGRPYADFVPGVRKQASIPAGGLVARPRGHRAGSSPGARGGGWRSPCPGLPASSAGCGRASSSRRRCVACSTACRFPSTGCSASSGRASRPWRGCSRRSGGEGDGLEVTICAHDLEIRVDMFSAAGGDERAERPRTRRSRSASRADLFAADERTGRGARARPLPRRSGSRWRRPSPAPAAWSPRG